MPRIDLITGFLGAGKTTFIKKYARYLIDQGLTVGILENDYGAINIDMVFLEDLMGDNCDVEMIVGGDGLVSHSRRFRTKLISMAMMGFDRVIVEPSGIYDTDEFFDALEEDPLCKWYSPGSIIAIVDADMETELSEETEYLLVSQTDCAGKIVLSRCGRQEKSGPDPEHTCAKEAALRAPSGRQEDSVPDPEQACRSVLELLNRAAKRFQSDRIFTAEDILAKDWDELNEEDFAAVASCGMVPSCHRKLPVQESSGYGTLFYYGIRMTDEELRKNLQETFSDPSCGRVMRIKGFVRIGDDERVQVNATPDLSRIDPTVFAREVLIITGENLCRERIDGIWAGFARIITPGKTTM